VRAAIYRSSAEMGTRSGWDSISRGSREISPVIIGRVECPADEQFLLPMWHIYIVMVVISLAARATRRLHDLHP